MKRAGKLCYSSRPIPGAGDRRRNGGFRATGAARLEGLGPGVALVVLFGFFGLGFLAFRTYEAKPPIPERVVDPGGRGRLHRRATSRAGQKVFLGNGLMEYGSVFGHGAYLGPDYTADYLRRASNFVRRAYGGARSDSAAQRTIEDFRTNRYDEGTGTLDADRARRPRPTGGWCGHYSALLLRAHDEARPAPERDHRPAEARGS